MFFAGSIEFLERRTGKNHFNNHEEPNNAYPPFGVSPPLLETMNEVYTYRIFRVDKHVGVHLAGTTLTPSHECDSSNSFTRYFSENDGKLRLEFFWFQLSSKPGFGMKTALLFCQQVSTY